MRLLDLLGQAGQQLPGVQGAAPHDKDASQESDPQSVIDSVDWVNRKRRRKRLTSRNLLIPNVKMEPSGSGSPSE
jgi:hypothetical protein